MIVKKTSVRKMFNERNIQISDSAVKMIADMVERDISRMVVRSIEGNVKRLTPDILYIALGNLLETHKE